MNKENLINLINENLSLILLEKEKQPLIELVYSNTEDQFYINIFNCNYTSEDDMWEQDKITDIEALEMYSNYLG